MNRCVVIKNGDGGSDHVISCLITCARRSDDKGDCITASYGSGSVIATEIVRLHGNYVVQVFDQANGMTAEWRPGDDPNHDELTAYVSAPEEMVRAAVLLIQVLDHNRQRDDETWAKVDHRQILMESIPDHIWEQYTGYNGGG